VSETPPVSPIPGQVSETGAAMQQLNPGDDSVPVAEEAGGGGGASGAEVSEEEEEEEKEEKKVPVLCPALWAAARDGRTEEVRQLLAEKADVEERGGSAKFTPLHIAAFQGRDAVLLLLDHGADISAKTRREGQDCVEYGWTALHFVHPQHSTPKP